MAATCPQNHKELEQTLAEHIYLSKCDLPGKQDAEVLLSLKAAPCLKETPNLYFWYVNLICFSPEVIKTWVVEAPAACQKAEPKLAAPATEEKKVDDDLDLFGDETEEDKQAAADQEAKRKAEAAAKKKAKPVAKSMIVFEVKVYEIEQDLIALANKIHSLIEMDGLVWNKNVINIKPVAFGMNKLELACVIEDDKIQTDDIFEKIAEWEEEVQNVDVVTFTKI